MPDLTVTVSAAQATRMANAFRFLNSGPNDPVGTPANIAQVEGWIRRQLRAQVLQFEMQQRRAEADQEAADALATEGWAP